MDFFLSNTEQLRKYYYEQIPTDDNATPAKTEIAAMDGAIMGIRGLQYLGYYLYRIWFKYMPLMLAANESIVGSRGRVMDPVISRLDISGSARRAILAARVPAPLAGRMPNDPDELNALILEIQTQLSSASQYQEAIHPGARHKMFAAMMDFIGKKEKLETVVEDLTRLKLLLPGLGRAGGAN